MKIKLHAQDIIENKWQEHKAFLSLIKSKVEEINKKFEYDPKSDTFRNRKAH
ncbi:TPA: hypothetical protein NPP28_003368 [Klebsiella quasipneumoniae subsp. similipneumoniae]|nr:hypothetical protein [Klebsiella quasipneumoniae subsp. similipneumoniae]